MLTVQQREERKLGLGGSDIPIILGLSTYKTPYELYLEKTELASPKSESPDDESQQQYWGNMLEPIIRSEFSKRHDVIVTTPDSVQHPIYDYLRANVDGYIPAWEEILEIKCSSAFMASQWGEDGSDIIPLSYLLQVAHYCCVMNVNAANIAVLIGGNDYREFKYIRDSTIEGKVLDAAKAFWDCVITKQAPDATIESDLKLMYPAPKIETKIIINDKIIHCVDSLAETKKQIKELTDIERQYRFEILQYMKDATCLIDSQGKSVATWKSSKKGTRTFLLK